MEEMKFINKDIYSDEEVSLATMCEYYDKTKSEMLKIGYETGNNKTFKIKGFNYIVLLPHGNKTEVRKSDTIPTIKPKISYYTKVDNKETGKNNRKAFVSNVVKYGKVNPVNKKYYIDGKITTKKGISEITGLKVSLLNRVLSRVKKMTLNGYEIRIKGEIAIYTAIKDGVYHKSLTTEQCSELTGLRVKTIYDLYKNGLYSRTDGWRITK